jgi:hypothetical protein
MRVLQQASTDQRLFNGPALALHYHRYKPCIVPL